MGYLLNHSETDVGVTSTNNLDIMTVGFQTQLNIPGDGQKSLLLQDFYDNMMFGEQERTMEMVAKQPMMINTPLWPLYWYCNIISSVHLGGKIYYDSGEKEIANSSKLILVVWPLL